MSQESDILDTINNNLVDVEEALLEINRTLKKGFKLEENEDD